MILTMPPTHTQATPLSSRPDHDSPHALSRDLSRDKAGLLLAIGSAALFSLKAVVVKLGLAHGLTVETLMAWRMLLALPVYVVVGLVAFRRAGSAPTARTVAAAAALGVLSYYVCTWLDFSGMQYISAQLERLILFTYPALTAVLAWAMLGERFTKRHAASLGLSYAGVLLVFGAEAGSAGPHAALGVGLVFAAALLFAFYVVLAKPVIAALGSQRFTCVAMIAATAAILTHRLVLSATAHPRRNRRRNVGSPPPHWPTAPSLPSCAPSCPASCSAKPSPASAPAAPAPRATSARWSRPAPRCSCCTNPSVPRRPGGWC